MKLPTKVWCPALPCTVTCGTPIPSARVLNHPLSHMHPAARQLQNGGVAAINPFYFVNSFNQVVTNTANSVSILSGFHTALMLAPSASGVLGQPPCCRMQLLFDYVWSPPWLAVCSTCNTVSRKHLSKRVAH